MNFTTKLRNSNILVKISPTVVILVFYCNSEIIKPERKRRNSRSKSLDLPEFFQPTPMQIIWWSQPDEKAVIKFKNGNIYEGNISMKCMNGKGKFQWADGSVYKGEFKQNTIEGKGKLLWKDECWYQGNFLGNLRHGKGLYVDPHGGHCYYGDWDLGTKHGNGVMYYSADLTNYYDGQWAKNVRCGHGIREYCRRSGYNGDWDFSLRNGKGTMIWPNGDFYTGDWKNGLISGSGRYLWDVSFNDTMTLPALISYDGEWFKGNRNGFGTLELGFDMGPFYQGEFKDMKKHGQGHFVTKNGLIIMDKELFVDDRLGSNISQLYGQNTGTDTIKKTHPNEPCQMKLYDNLSGLRYHIQAALLKLDKEAEIRTLIIRKYFENNKHLKIKHPKSVKSTCVVEKDDQSTFDLDSFILFEEYSLLNKIKFYEDRLSDMYEMYANACTSKKVAFPSVMIRMFLWQFYYDCDIHEWGLSLVDIDNMFHKNRECLGINPHDPFESIQFWQFLHSLIMVSNELFARRHLPGPKPETILAEAFRFFMDNVAIPSYGSFKGHLKKFGPIVPLKGMYKLYRSIGEPHTIRDFLCAARRSPILIAKPQPKLVDAPDSIPRGRNTYLFGDQMVYIVNDKIGKICSDDIGKEVQGNKELPLHNFGNLSSESIIKIFSNILPDVFADHKVRNLDIQYTFMEFFQAFIGCAEESVRVTEEENRWRKLIGVKKKKAKEVVTEDLFISIDPGINYL